MEAVPGTGALAVSSGARFAREVRLRPARRIELLAHLSGAFDLAEGQAPGHAARVAYVAYRVAETLGLTAEERRRVLHVGLLHDAGLSMHWPGGPQAAGAHVAMRLHLDPQVCEAVQAAHERWDGAGTPGGLSATRVPLEALCAAVGHWTVEFADRVAHPLRARAALQRLEADAIAPVGGPEVAAAAVEVLRHDETWLALWDDDLASVIGTLGAGEGKPSHRKVFEIAVVLGEVVDAAVREAGRAERVATLAHILAARLGLSDGVCDAVEVAGYLLDLGQLGVPRSVTEKPSILTVDEMELMRRHPGLGARLLEGVPGFEAIASWVEQHHERPDGRGYPEMLTRKELALPPRILGVADAYWALRADRPYRPAVTGPEALATIQSAAGRQFDADVVAVLPAAIAAFEAAANDR